MSALPKSFYDTSSVQMHPQKNMPNAVSEFKSEFKIAANGSDNFFLALRPLPGELIFSIPSINFISRFSPSEASFIQDPQKQLPGFQKMLGCSLPGGAPPGSIKAGLVTPESGDEEGSRVKAYALAYVLREMTGGTIAVLKTNNTGVTDRKASKEVLERQYDFYIKDISWDQFEKRFAQKGGPEAWERRANKKIELDNKKSTEQTGDNDISGVLTGIMKAAGFLFFLNSK